MNWPYGRSWRLLHRFHDWRIFHRKPVFNTYVFTHYSNATAFQRPELRLHSLSSAIFKRLDVSGSFVPDSTVLTLIWCNVGFLRKKFFDTGSPGSARGPVRRPVPVGRLKLTARVKYAPRLTNLSPRKDKAPYTGSPPASTIRISISAAKINYGPVALAIRLVLQKASPYGRATDGIIIFVGTIGPIAAKPTASLFVCSLA